MGTVPFSEKGTVPICKGGYMKDNIFAAFFDNYGVILLVDSFDKIKNKKMSGFREDWILL